MHTMSACHGSSDKRWVAAQWRDTTYATAGRSAGTVRHRILTAECNDCLDLHVWLKDRVMPWSACCRPRSCPQQNSAQQTALFVMVHRHHRTPRTGDGHQRNFSQRVARSSRPAARGSARPARMRSRCPRRGTTICRTGRWRQARSVTPSNARPAPLTVRHCAELIHYCAGWLRCSPCLPTVLPNVDHIHAHQGRHVMRC